MRCFIAINLDDAVKAALAKIQGKFRDLPGKVSWTNSDQMHLTLKFLGELPDDKIDQAAKLLEQCAGQVGTFDFTIAGLGAFPPGDRQLRVLWVGIDAPPELIKLNELCEQAFDELGVPAEKREFKPHLTIARIRQTKQPDTFRRVIAENKDFVAGTQSAEKVVLYASELEPTGAIHTPLATIALGKQ